MAYQMVARLTPSRGVAWDENEILARCKVGDLDAFDTLVRLHERKVFNLTYRMTGSREDAQDLTQETFLRAFGSIKRFRGDCSIGRWLTKIAYNVTTDLLRARARKRCSSLDVMVQTQQEEALPLQVAGDAPSPDDRLLFNELWEAVWHGMRCLSPEQRAVMYLRDVQDMSYEEIAGVVGCPVGTVKSRLNRARLAVRSRLSSYLATETGLRPAPL